MRTIKQILVILLVILLAANIATVIYQGTTDTTQGPIIECDNTILEVDFSCSEKDLLAGVTAKDGQDGDLTDHVIVASVSKLITNDTAKVTYLVFDSDDNMASFVRRIRYRDYCKPTFDVLQPLIYSTSEEVDLLSRLYAYDERDGDISNQIRVSTLAATDNPELFDITIQVTNSVGDTSSLKLPVLRQRDNPLRPKITLTKQLVYISQNSEFDPSVYVKDAAVLGVSLPVENVKIHNPVDTSTPGTYQVVYTCTTEDATGLAVLTVVVQ